MIRTDVNPQEAAAQATATAWADVGIEPVGAAPRLSPEQPDHGLLWVTRGAVLVSRSGREHEIRKGTVVAYRLGPDLEWAVPAGAHVRWCRRDVSVGVGQVAPWTTDLSIDGPIAARPAHRGLYATLTVAMAWLVALTVAWCYDGASADRIEARFEGLKKAVLARSITNEGNALLDDVQSAILASTSESVSVESPREGLLWVTTHLPLERVDAFLSAMPTVAKVAGAGSAGFRRMDIRIGEPGKSIDEWALRYSVAADGTLSCCEGSSPRPPSEPRVLPSIVAPRR